MRNATYTPFAQEEGIAAVVTEAPAKAPATPKPRKRAHKNNGQFQADDPATPKVNEAWQKPEE